MSSHLVQGQRVTMPVEIREAAACSAMYLVRADAARAIVAYSGLDVAEPLPGRAVCSLAFVRYVDGDLGPYHEFAVAFLVRPPDAGPPPDRGLGGLADLARSGVGAFIHWLPVNQGFTLDAGRSIWGFPKEMSDIELRWASPYKRCTLRKDGRVVVDMLFRPGVPMPAGAARTSFDAFSHRDGVTRRTPWLMRPYGVRGRPGGALLRLGNHPIAKELSELGLPKRPLMSTTVEHLRMTFSDAEPVTPPRPASTP
ncbi:acetoacetate decarboxylase family protein [Bailinhaonella thermotolerans]|uniref:Acetoacetate decarboxylase n=1 Tax=Bailinhaonella thermotolerans TaxID=1070861 RepID=A0A3A4ALL3_9ACTN|nr:acetoacetate decarboxylase family protein [Bailinhaonella thermotolerans]RJL30506.1 acetoacetate decarboxylase [Bailinhaonella thermotolerans]